MAKISLTIFDVVTSEGGTASPEQKSDISISIGDNLVEGTFSKEIKSVEKAPS